MKKFIAVIIALLLSVTSLILIGCDRSGSVNSGNSVYIEFYLEETLYKRVKADNAVYKLPDEPEKGGYDFDGWYWDKDLWENPLTEESVKNKIDSGEKTLKVYAKWYKSETVSGVSQGVDFSVAECLTPEGETDEAYFERLEYEIDFILRISLNDEEEIVQDITQVEINGIKYRKSENKIKNFIRNGKTVSVDLLLKYDSAKVFKLNSVIIVDELDAKKYANIKDGQTIADLSNAVIDDYFEYNAPVRNKVIEEIKKLNGKQEYTITQGAKTISVNMQSQRMTYKDILSSYKQVGNVRYTEDPEIGKIKTESDFQPLGTKSLSGFTGDIDTLLSDIVVIESEGKGSEYSFEVKGEAQRVLLGKNVSEEVVYTLDIYSSGADISVKTGSKVEFSHVDFSFTDFVLAEDEYYWTEPTKDAVYSQEYLQVLTKMPIGYAFSNYNAKGNFIVDGVGSAFEFSCYTEIKDERHIDTAQILFEGKNSDFIDGVIRKDDGSLKLLDAVNFFQLARYAPAPFDIYDSVMLSAALKNGQYTVFFKTQEFAEILENWGITDAVSIVNAYEEIVFNNDNSISSDIFVVYKKSYNEYVKIRRSAVYTNLNQSLEIQNREDFPVLCKQAEYGGIKINSTETESPNNLATTIGNNIYVGYGNYIVSVDVDDSSYEVLPMYGTNLRSYADRYLSYKNGEFIYFYDTVEKTVTDRIYVGDIDDYVVMDEVLYCLSEGTLKFKGLDGTENNLTLDVYPDGRSFINTSDTYFIVTIENDNDSYANWNIGEHYVVKNGELLHTFKGTLESFNESRITVSGVSYSATTFETVDFPVLKMVETDYYGNTEIKLLGVYGENEAYIITKNGFYDKNTKINSIVLDWSYFSLLDVYYLKDGRIILNKRDSTDMYNVGSFVVVGTTGGIKNIDIAIPEIPYAEVDENDVFSVNDFDLKTNSKYKIIGNDMFAHYYETERTPLYLQRINVQTKQVIWDVQLPCEYYPGYIKDMFVDGNYLYVIYTDGLWNSTYTGYKLDMATGSIDSNFTVNGLLIGVYNSYKVVKTNGRISVLDDKNETVYYYDPSDYEYGFDTKIYGDKLYISFSNKYNSSNTVIVIDLTTFAKVLENQNLSFDLEVEDSIFVNGMIISEYYIYDIETFGIIGSYEGNVQFVLNGYLYTSQGIYDLTTLRKVYNFKYNGYAFDALIIVGDKVYVSREGQYGKYRRVLLP